MTTTCVDEAIRSSIRLKLELAGPVMLRRKAMSYGMRCDVLGEHGEVIEPLIDFCGDTPVVTVLPYCNIEIHLRLVESEWRLL